MLIGNSEALKHHIKGFLSGRLLISWGLLISGGLISRGLTYILGTYILGGCLYLGRLKSDVFLGLQLDGVITWGWGLGWGL